MSAERIFSTTGNPIASAAAAASAAVATSRLCGSAMPYFVSVASSVAGDRSLGGAGGGVAGFLPVRCAWNHSPLSARMVGSSPCRNGKPASVCASTASGVIW